MKKKKEILEEKIKKSQTRKSKVNNGLAILKNNPGKI